MFGMKLRKTYLSYAQLVILTLTKLFEVETPLLSMRSWLNSTKRLDSFTTTNFISRRE